MMFCTASLKTTRELLKLSNSAFFSLSPGIEITADRARVERELEQAAGDGRHGFGLEGSRTAAGFVSIYWDGRAGSEPRSYEPPAGYNYRWDGESSLASSSRNERFDQPGERASRHQPRRVGFIA